MAISGMPGLYRFVSQAKNCIIVESLTDKKRFPAYASSKVSALQDVAIFTESGETPLKEVLQKIYEKEQGGPVTDPRSATNDDLKARFSEVLPDYDREKVYVSDIKKVFTWYNLLHQLGMLDLPDEEDSNGSKAEEPGMKAETEDGKDLADEKSDTEDKAGENKPL